MSWQDDYRNALKTTDELRSFLVAQKIEELTPLIDDLPIKSSYPVLCVPAHLRDLIAHNKREELTTLLKQFIPSTIEDDENIQSIGLTDPIGDFSHMKAPQLIHRYDNRALFTPTTICPVLCRYCFRKNELFHQREQFSADFQTTTMYLKQHPEIEEIIFTGGDPFILSDQKLKYYVEAFSEIPTLKYIRIHTRTPTILPSRVTSELLSILEEARNHFDAVNVSIHVNHPGELTPTVSKALLELSRHVPGVLAQTVLLKGINSDPSVLENLFKGLVRLGVRPYYLHHPDQVKGSMHTTIDLLSGRKLYHCLRQRLPGWAIPHYVIDLPGGEGKVSAFNPENFEFSGSFINKNHRKISPVLSNE